MWKCTLTISRFTIPMDPMRTSLTFQTTVRQPSLNTKEFCIVKAKIMNRILRILPDPYLIPFLQEEWNYKVDATVSYCMVDWGLTFSQLLNCSIQLWKLDCVFSELDPFFTLLATTAMSVLELWIFHFRLVLLLSRMIITKKEWICSLMFL